MNSKSYREMRRNRRKTHWNRDLYYRRLIIENKKLKKKQDSLVKEITYVPSYMGNVIELKADVTIDPFDREIPEEYIKNMIRDKIARKISDFIEYQSYKECWSPGEIYEGRLWLVTR